MGPIMDMETMTPKYPKEKVKKALELLKKIWDEPTSKQVISIIVKRILERKQLSTTSAQ